MDSVPLLSLPGFCHLSGLIVPTVCPVASCDRLRGCVPVSLAYVCSAPWPLRSAWWSSRPGWLLNLSLAGLYVGAFLYWTLAVLEAGLPSRPLLALPRLLSPTWLVVSTAVPMASCVGLNVALALSSSLLVASDPLL